VRAVEVGRGRLGPLLGKERLGPEPTRVEPGLTAATIEPARLSRALHAVGPRAVILTGRHASLDALARLVYAARREGDPVAVFDYRGALPDSGASTVERLNGRPLAAAERILAALDGAPAERRRTLRAVNI